MKHIQSKCKLLKWHNNLKQLNQTCFTCRIFIRRCVKYLVDVVKPKSFQWFDLPFYDDEDSDFQSDEVTRVFVESNNLLEMKGDYF